MNVEFAKSIHALKLCETIERNFAGTRDKLEQLGTFFLIERPDSTPEPLNLRGRRRVVVILRVVLPVVHIDLRQTRNQQF